MKSKIASLTRILLLLAAILLIISLFVPIWSIYLDAPQYPEGLSLQIWANAIAGDVDIINGLNHYIGMKTLHTEDFIEFTILPYLIVLYAILFVAAAFWGRKKGLYIVFGAFVLFGIVAMVDFWQWEYNYGHDLDPDAAIKVPGMAYQPPLIGFKQLLNFGAYSIPDIGGWLFVAAGMLGLVAVLMETGFLNRFRKHKGGLALVAGLMISLASCGTTGPQPVILHKDACASCKMSVSDGHFGAEIITKKGRAYKFDDLNCMLRYLSENGKDKVDGYYVHDFNKENELIDAEQAWYVHHESLRSPMGGNTAAFPTRAEAGKAADELGVQVQNWASVSTLNDSGDEHQH